MGRDVYALASKAIVFFRNASVGRMSTIVDAYIWYRVLTNKGIDHAYKKLTKLCIG